VPAEPIADNIPTIPDPIDAIRENLNRQLDEYPNSERANMVDLLLHYPDRDLNLESRERLLLSLVEDKGWRLLLTKNPVPTFAALDLRIKEHLKLL
jgi:hypothetical protein